MARIKEIRKNNGLGAKSHGIPKTPREPSTPAPAPTVKPPERCKIVMEMGASHTQLMIKRPGKAWEYVKFGRGAGASSISGVDVVPTMTAIRSRDDSLDVRHGISALNARISDSRSWTVLQHLKHAYLSEAPTADVDRTLKSQQEVARERGWDIEDLADQYFYDILSRATKEDIGSPILFTNISDVWPNKVAQRLICGFQKVLPGAEVHGVNECLSSLIGAMSMETATAAEPIQLVYVDCGHSTMERCAATVNPSEPRFVVHPESYRSEPWGAGMIDMAVENELRAMNEDADEDDINKGVWETLQFISEHVKPDMDSDFSARAGFGEPSWRRVMRVAREADKRLNNARVDLILELIRETYVSGADNRLLLSGRASLSRTFVAKLKAALSGEFPDIRLLHKVEERTYVISGLACMADDWKEFSVNAAPMSLWLRSDPDTAEVEDDEDDDENESEDYGGQQEAVRICRKGQALNPKVVGRFDRNPSYAIHYELSCKRGQPEIDLSVFGTPSELSDEDVIVRKGKPGGGKKSHECLVFSQPDKLTRFGEFRKELPMRSERADGTYHAYVFSKITKVGITLFAVFAEDGHKMPTLETQSMEVVLQEISLSSSWRSHDGVTLKVVRLGQVARPEFLVGKPGVGSAPQPHGRSLGSQERSASKPDHDRDRSKRRRVDEEMIL